MGSHIVIIGGGIAGLSCAAALAPHTQVTLVESESTLAYHATGRSAALYTECYGAGPVSTITKAARSFYTDGDEPLGSVRPVLFVAAPGDEGALAALTAEYGPNVPSLESVDPDEIERLVSVLPAHSTSGGILEPDAMDLDVHGMVTNYERAIRSHSGRILSRTPFRSLTRRTSGWSVLAGDTEIETDVVVNASGAWGDLVARSSGIDPMPLSPLKRSAFTFDPGLPASHWPFVVDVHERWYIKPEGPHVLGSAASEIPVEPSDARPDEIDVALAIDRITTATTLAIRTVKNQWAGIRTFTPDRVPAVGFEPGSDHFFWLVGQGGYGVMTSPSIGALCASLILGRSLPDELVSAGVRVEDFDPGRFR